MDSLRKNVELAANVGIVVFTILLCLVLVKNQFFSPVAPYADNNRKAANGRSLVGEKIDLPQVNWQQNGQTLLLALSTTCYFCSESMVFYQQLLRERSRGTSIIAVFPEPVKESKEYLNKHGVSVDDVKQVNLTEIGVDATPTVLFVDDKGVVRGMWLGKLPNSEEVKIIGRVQQSIAKK